MILVDTSVWVGHLREGDERLKALLYDEQVLFHPFVIGELACGNLANRQEILALLTTLPQARMAEHGEVMYLIESKRLQGRGLEVRPERGLSGRGPRISNAKPSEGPLGWRVGDPRYDGLNGLQDAA